MIDAEYGRWRVVIKDCAASSAQVVFYRLDSQTISGEWIIHEISSQEFAQIDLAGFHMHRRIGIDAEDFMRWLHKKIVDLPNSPARINLLKLMVVCAIMR